MLTLNAPGGFEPEPGLDRDTYEAARAARHPLFCYGYAPRTETCVMLVSPREVMVLGRRLLQ